MLEKMETDKERFIPEEGFNLVGVDDFELPGDQLYLIGHFTTRKEAEAELERRKKEGRSFFVYGPDDA